MFEKYRISHGIGKTAVCKSEKYNVSYYIFKQTGDNEVVEEHVDTFTDVQYAITEVERLNEVAERLNDNPVMIDGREFSREPVWYVLRVVWE